MGEVTQVTPKKAKRADRSETSEPRVAAAIRPTAAPTEMRARHWGLLFSLGVVILLPVFVAASYLSVFAQDQYASTVGFTIRQDDSGSASELMGGLRSVLGGSAQGHAELLFEFVQSQEIVERIDAEFDLIGHYSANWPGDPVFAIRSDATIEDLVRFWGRMVRVTHDRASGLMLVQVRARDPASAQAIARLIVSESEAMINRLNSGIRADAMRNAEADLEASVARLRAAREALAEFRARTQIVDPQADIQGRMGVLSNLQQQLAEALVDYDLVSQTANETDPRVRQLERRIEAIRTRIREERENFARQDVTVDDTDYPRLIAQFESLQVDQAFAEATYQAALTAFDTARSNASRQTLYLANFIQPTFSQRAEYPQRLLIIALTAVFATLLWGILALVFYSLRDRG